MPNPTNDQSLGLSHSHITSIVGGVQFDPKAGFMPVAFASPNYVLPGFCIPPNGILTHEQRPIVQELTPRPQPLFKD